ncbi:MAG: methyltransferase [Hyphomonas sp.]
MHFSDRLANWKNRLIASSRFQTFAISNPLLRPVALRKAAASFDLVAGFVYSQILQAVVEAGLLERAREQPLDAADLAGETGWTTDGAERLLRAAAALDLLRQQADRRYGLGETGAGLLGNPPVFAMVRHHKALYSDLTDAAGLLSARRSDTELSQYWAYDQCSDPSAARVYSALMAETQSLIAEQILSANDLSSCRCLMDVGGGLGAFIEKAGARYAHLQLRLIDLPQVAAMARERLGGHLLSGRLEILGLDALTEALPRGADAVTLVRVLHDHDDGPALQLLQNVRAALPSGGRLIIAEPLAGVRGAKRMGDAYFGMYLWAMGRGKPRTFDEMRALLRQAGFPVARLRRTHNPLLVSCVTAH